MHINSLIKVLPEVRRKIFNIHSYISSILFYVSSRYISAQCYFQYATVFNYDGINIQFKY